VKRERSRINKINNGFVSQKELSQAALSYNLEIHRKKFSVGNDRLDGKQASVFLPPINKESLQNLKTKVNLIKVQIQGGPPKNPRGYHLRRDSETERQSLLKLDKNSTRKMPSFKTQKENEGQLYISAFDPAHITLPKYSNSYQSVKNLAPVLECLKGQGGRADQNTLQW